MTTAAQKCKEISEELYQGDYKQITIDLVQEEVEPLFEGDVTRDSVSAVAYQCDILAEVFNPKFHKDIYLLHRLHEALDKWSNDIEGTNTILGIPKHK